MNKKHNYGTAVVENKYYVRRNQDDILTHAIQGMGRPVHIVGPNQTGKTNLMLNIIRELDGEEYKFVYVDCSPKFESVSEFYEYLANSIYKVLKIKPDRTEYANMNPHKIHMRDITTCLNAIKINLVICLDEVENLLQYEYSDQVFAFIRSIYFQRTNYEELERLTYVTIGAVYAREFISNPSTSPFNISITIVIDCFLLNEIAELFSRHGSTQSNEIIERIHYWTGGNPKMVSEIFFKINSTHTHDQELTITFLDNLIERMYFSNNEISTISELKYYIAENHDLASAIMMIQKGSQELVDTKVLQRLYFAGIITLDHVQGPYFSSKVIEHAMSPQWINRICTTTGVIPNNESIGFQEPERYTNLNTTPIPEKLLFNKIINNLKNHRIISIILICGITIIALANFTDAIGKLIQLLPKNGSYIQANSLPGNTGWILVGNIDKKNNIYIRGPLYEIVKSNYPKHSIIPRKGELIKVSSDRNIIIADYKTDGLSKRLQPPWQENILDDDDYTDFTISKGSIAEVKEVSIGGLKNESAVVWVRIGVPPN